MARQIVLTRLSAAPRTRAELASTLAQRDVAPEVAAAVLDRMEEVRLVDDTAFAGAWVRSRQAHRGLARRALAGELRRKGVMDDVAEQALAQVDADDERIAATALVERRLRSMRGLDEAVRTRRLVGMLARRGYGGGLAAQVVRDVLRREVETDP